MKMYMKFIYQYIVYQYEVYRYIYYLKLPYYTIYKINIIQPPILLYKIY